MSTNLTQGQQAANPAAAATGDSASLQSQQQPTMTRTEPEEQFEIAEIPDVQVEGGTVPDGPTVEALQARLQSLESASQQSQALLSQWQQYANGLEAQLQRGGQRQARTAEPDDEGAADPYADRAAQPQVLPQVEAISRKLAALEAQNQQLHQRLEQFQLGTAREKIQGQVQAAISKIDQTHPGLVTELDVIHTMRNNPDLSAVQAAAIAAKKRAEGLKKGGYVLKRPVAAPPPVPTGRDGLQRPQYEFSQPARNDDEFNQHLSELLGALLPELPD